MGVLLALSSCTSVGIYAGEVDATPAFSLTTLSFVKTRSPRRHATTCSSALLSGRGLAAKVTHPLFDVTLGWRPHQSGRILCLRCSSSLSLRKWEHSDQKCLADANASEHQGHFVLLSGLSSPLAASRPCALRVGVLMAPPRQIARRRLWSAFSESRKWLHALLEDASMSMSSKPSSSLRGLLWRFSRTPLVDSSNALAQILKACAPSSLDTSTANPLVSSSRIANLFRTFIALESKRSSR